MTGQYDMFNQGSASQFGERQTDLEELIEESHRLEATQTKYRGSNDQEYQIYLSCADDGKGGDITRNGLPLKTYGEWLNS